MAVTNRRLTVLICLFLSLAISIKITLGGSTAAWFIAGRSLFLPAQFVCTRLVRLNLSIYGLYVCSLSPLRFVLAAICFLFSPWWRPGSPLHANLQHARLLARCLSSPLLCQLLSLPLSAQAQKRQFNVRLTFKGAFHCSLPLLACSLSSWPLLFIRLEETEMLRLIAIDFWNSRCSADWNGFIL